MNPTSVIEPDVLSSPLGLEAHCFREDLTIETRGMIFPNAVMHFFIAKKCDLHFFCK
jgi:hypothetical protein